MNKMMTRKSVLKPQQDTDRRVARKGTKNSQSGRKTKDQRKLKTKAKKMPNKNQIILQELAEYESSRQEIPANPLSETRSNNSVIYIQTFSHHEKVPVIDLTRSSSSIVLKGPNKRCVLNGKPLQTLYKRKTINIVNAKNLTAKSLIAIPVTCDIKQYKNPYQPRKIVSNPQLELSQKQRVDILGLPSEFIDESDFSEYNFMDLDKADLDRRDLEMINTVMDVEQDEYQSLLSISSRDLLKLNNKKSVKEMCLEYGVNGSDTVP